MKVYVVVLITGGLLDEVHVEFREARAIRKQDAIARRVWGDKPPEDYHDEEHDVYLTTTRIPRRELTQCTRTSMSR